MIELEEMRVTQKYLKIGKMSQPIIVEGRMVKVAWSG